MEVETHPQSCAAGVERERTRQNGQSNQLCSLDIFSRESAKSRSTATRDAVSTLDCSADPLAKADQRKAAVDGNFSQVAEEKPLRKSELPEYKKFTPEEQAKVAKDLAKEIAEKGFKDSPELRDKVREAMLRVYLDGDRNSQGDEKKMEAFVKQISDNLPKGMSLRIDTSTDNKDLAAFRERAQKAIDNQPGMKMGASGQLQLCKEESGKTTVIDKLHYAASVKKEPETRKA